MQNRPNILIISTGQHRADCLGIVGRKVKTPHLDALARSGTRFGNCITASASSQPSRASILTGQLGHQHGVTSDGIDLDSAIGSKGFAGTLHADGYNTALFGKAEFATHSPAQPSGSPECAISSGDFDARWNGPYMGFEHVQLMMHSSNRFSPEVPPRGQHYERFFHADGRGKTKLHNYTRDMGMSMNPASCWHSGLSPANHNIPWTADKAINWLNHGRDKNKPFCGWVSFADVAAPFDCPEPWSRLHQARDIDLPAQQTLDSSNMPAWYDAKLHDEETDFDIGINQSDDQQVPDEQLREIIANAYGKIAFVDNQVGRLMNTLAEQGLLNDTHIFYLSDRGDWLGDHGRITAGPMIYECNLRVPLLWSGPGVPKDRVIYEPVSTIDISPTLSELTGITPQLEQQGKDLSQLLDGRSARNFAVSEWQAPAGRTGNPTRVRSVRTRTYKLSKELNSGYGQLFDLLADPQETTNLYGQPRHAEVQMRLESYLAMPVQQAA